MALANIGETPFERGNIALVPGNRLEVREQSRCPVVTGRIPQCDRRLHIGPGCFSPLCRSGNGTKNAFGLKEHTINRIEELLPWNWAANQAKTAADQP